MQYKTDRNTDDISNESEQKNELKIPNIGTKFMVDGIMYKVTYVNPGKNRFTSEPCKNHY